MAFQEIIIDEPASAPSAGFVKFNAIGDTFTGLFVSAGKVSSQYGEKEEYRFKNKAGEHAISPPPADLLRKLKAANLQPGHAVRITFTGTKPLEGKEHPMKLFKVFVEREFAKPAPKPAEDDLPF